MTVTSHRRIDRLGEEPVYRQAGVWSTLKPQLRTNSLLLSEQRSQMPPPAACRIRPTRLTTALNPEEVINVADFERAAAKKLDAGTAGYFFGGACDEVTLEGSVVAWRRRRLRARGLAGHSAWETRATVLGSEVSSPVLVAPVA